MRSRPTSRLRPVAAIAVALISLAAAAPAHAAEGTAPPARSSGIFLTVTGQDNAWVRGVLLDCVTRQPGHHPHAAKACAAIDKARGDFDALPAKSGICTKQYAPVTVSATGVHRGKPVSWNKTYGNACEMGYATGAVFRF
ncbi:SSI family serine proteinase inhibitor [Streptomyces durmitorensis]|uniref:Subtilase-type protease inhibitor n=1 Tax=Streptomyces durmitorensis TaxID=319947 RepID=A0ABY4PNL5_9ACTN|nr:SSI family serine proteinase inhibitor [Streptomyces durmitorensis]UQT54459.1 subtilase-type protease inhibitor [Streptomyces durmitorensis]